MGFGPKSHYPWQVHKLIMISWNINAFSCPSYLELPRNISVFCPLRVNICFVKSELKLLFSSQFWCADNVRPNSTSSHLFYHYLSLFCLCTAAMKVGLRMSPIPAHNISDNNTQHKHAPAPTLGWPEATGRDRSSLCGKLRILPFVIIDYSFTKR